MFLTNMTSPFGIPRETSQSSVQWVQERASNTPDSPELDSVSFVPKVAVDMVNISRKFIDSNSVGSELFVVHECTSNLAVALDGAGINGQGAMSYQPEGLLQNAAIQTNSSDLAIGANGGVVEWPNILDLEETLAINNADFGMQGYLSTPQLRAKLKQTPKISGSNAVHFCWEGSVMNGLPAEATNNVPANLSKGSGTNLSALIFANWRDLIVATFHDGIDVLVNPYSNQASAAVAVSLNLYADCNVRHAESFAVIYDAAIS